MSDMRSEAMIDEQLDLITQYLNSQLDPERAEEVRRRLQQDRDFLQLAAPLLLAWDAMRNGRPARAGESERRWDEFTKKAGFVHQRKKRIARRLWLLGIALLVIAPAIYLNRLNIRDAWYDARYFSEIPAGQEWQQLPDSSWIQLAVGSRARVSTQRLYDGAYQIVKLNGTAHFRIEPPNPGGTIVPQTQPLSVDTRAGRVYSHEGHFSVTTRGDTTDVEVFRPARRSFAGIMALPTQVFLHAPGMVNPLELHETEAGRVVKGEAARKTRSLNLPSRQWIAPPR